MKSLLLTTAALSLLPLAALADGPVDRTVNNARFTAQDSTVTGTASEYRNVSIMREMEEGNRSGHVLMTTLRISGGTLDDLNAFASDCATRPDGRKVFVSGTGLESYADGDGSAPNAPREKLSATEFSGTLLEGDACFGPIQSDFVGLTANSADGSVIITERATALMTHMASASLQATGITGYASSGEEVIRAGKLLVSMKAANTEDAALASASMTTDLTDISAVTGDDTLTGSMSSSFSCAPDATSIKASSDLPGFLVMTSGVDLAGSCFSPREMKVKSGHLDVVEGEGFAEVARIGVNAILDEDVGAPPFVVAALTMKKAQIFSVLDVFAAGNFEARLAPSEPVGAESLMGAAMMGEEAMKKVLGFQISGTVR